MKKKTLFRTLTIGLSLALMLVMIPAQSVMALAATINVEPDEGEIGDAFSINGTGALGVEYDLYFSSESADIGEDIDEDVENYEYLTSVTANTLNGIIYPTTNLFVPDELTDGEDDEPVHGGIYYIYMTGAGSKPILDIATFNVVGVAEITDYSPDDGTVGTEVEISGEGMAPDENIIVEYDGEDITDDVYDAFADDDGEFTLSFDIPPSEYGEHDITITGEDSLAELEETFTVIPEIMLDPVSGEGGINVTITGTGFDKNNYVLIYFNGDEVKTKRADSNGSFDTFFTIPEDLDVGTYTVVAEDEDDDDIWDDATFTITTPPLNTDINVTPLSGNVGDSVTVTGTEFASDDSVTIYFDGVSVGTASTDGSGNFTYSFNIPASAAGSHVVKAEDTEDYSDTASVTVEPEITVTPLSGVMNDEIDISGTGFVANKDISIHYGAVAVSPSALIKTGTDGSFSGSFLVPALTGGSGVLTISDGTNSLTVNFTVGAGITMSPLNGTVDAGVGMAGYGFGANKTISVKFNTTQVALLTPVTTDNNGTFSNLQFYVPASPGGVAVITVSDGTISKTISFTVEPKIAIDKITDSQHPGYVGVEFSVSGEGYKANADVEVVYTSDPVVLKTGKVGANGSFTIDFAIPPSAAEDNPHTIVVTVDDVTVKEYAFFMESTAPLAPGLAAVYAGTKAEASISFDWYEVTGDVSLPISYKLQVYTEDVNDVKTVVIGKTLTNTKYTLTEVEIEMLLPLEKGEYYYWNVQAVDAAGNASVLSDTDSFTIGGGGGWPTWLTWLLVGLGAIFLFIFAIMLGRRIAYSSY